MRYTQRWDSGGGLHRVGLEEEYKRVELDTYKDDVDVDDDDDFN